MGHSAYRVPRRPSLLPGQDQKRRFVPRYVPRSQLGCQCSPLYAIVLQDTDLPMKKATKCMYLAAFVLVDGGAGGN